ncbi:MAG: hypothetical protein MUF34_02915 [Polyangiaceae bacterium]|nr:hypothetical protein [Polyangiaceae bacterium]
MVGPPVQPQRPAHDGRYDEALERLHAYGPECSNGFSNHSTMAVEALARLGLGDEIAPFVRDYEPQLVPAQPPGAPLPADEQRAALGHAALFPRWQATFRAALAEATPRDVLARWAPVLAPGSLAAAFHGVLMTTHALRGLEGDVKSPVRLADLTRGLAYWAATYQALPGAPRHEAGGAALASLLDDLPVGQGLPGGAIDAGVDQATRSNAAFIALTSRPRALEADPIAPLVAAGARALLAHPDLPIHFVHAITGPMAFRTLGRWLDAPTFERSVDYLWQASAGLLVAFSRTPLTHAAEEGAAPGRERLVEAALASRDEHAIKVVEAALAEEHVTGGGLAARAAELACRRILTLRA